MGGNLLNGKRISSSEHSTIQSEVISSIKNNCYGISDLSSIVINTIPYIKEKQDHGDIDLIVSSVDFNKLKTVLSKHFVVKTTATDMFSILYKGVQVDLIYIPERFVDYATNYFSWSDLGNLIGRLARPLGFKHGHNGLRYLLMYNTTKIKEYCLSNNFEDILNILGLNTTVYKNGFDTYKEMFDFVISSPYFDKNLFLFENLNNKNRVRDKKRKTYNMFLEYLDTIEINKIPKVLNEPQFNFVCRHFPTTYNLVMYDYTNHLEHIKTRSEIVSYLRETYNLEGKVLGNAIIKLKEIGLFKLPINKNGINIVIKHVT